MPSSASAMREKAASSVSSLRMRPPGTEPCAACGPIAAMTEQDASVCIANEQIDRRRAALNEQHRGSRSPSACGFLSKRVSLLLSGDFRGREAVLNRIATVVIVAE